MIQEYYDSLNDPRWSEKRKIILRRDDYTCKVCGNKAEVVHHIRYWNGSDKKAWLSPNECLVSLCEGCHKLFHSHSANFCFWPGNPPRVINEEVFYSYQNFITDEDEMCMPIWDEALDLLKNLDLQYDVYCVKELEYAILLPPESLLYEKRLCKRWSGADEIDNVISSTKYAPKQLQCIIDNFQIKAKFYPSLSKNIRYICSFLKEAFNTAICRPYEGLYVKASKSKKNGYSIKIWNISDNELVSNINFDNDKSYIACNPTDAIQLGIVYAIAYLEDLSEKESADYSYIPIFPSNPNGISQVENILSKYKSDADLSDVKCAGILKAKVIEIVSSIRTLHTYTIREWLKEWGITPDEFQISE